MTFQEMREGIRPSGGITITGPSERALRFFRALDAVDEVLAKLFRENEKGGEGNGQQEEDQAPQEA